MIEQTTARMTEETTAIIARARADIAAHVADADAYRPIATTLLDAVEALVTAVINQAAVDKARVGDLEAQVIVLATAVLSITEAVCQASPAIIALQDEMSHVSGVVNAEVMRSGCGTVPAPRAQHLQDN